MITTNLNHLDLSEFIGKNDLRQRCQATFPLTAVHGSKQIAVVYFEIESGDNLGSHTDSAEELLVVLKGDVTVTLSNEIIEVSKGGLVLIPRMALHDIKNTGMVTAKVLGVFGGANNIVATFENEWSPVNSRIVDTTQLI